MPLSAEVQAEHDRLRADDLNPIEAGRLPNGEPDLFFHGFYCWNSEVGARTLGIASFYLRAVCMNRNLWGVEQFEEVTIRHSKYATAEDMPEAADRTLTALEARLAEIAAEARAFDPAEVARAGA